MRDKDSNDGAPKRNGVPIEWLAIAVACGLPLISLATCSAALGPDHDDTGDLYFIALGLFAASAVAGFVVLLFALLGKMQRAGVIALIVNVLGLAANVAYFFTHFTYTRGRQLRSAHGRVLPQRKKAALGSARSRAARAWRDNGDTEAASVCAFSLLSLDLAELGAPLALIEAAHRDALDEVHHAELCYGLARRFGELAEIAPMPSLPRVRARGCSIERVAVESWVEGAYLESVSAALAGDLAGRVDDPAIAAVLHTIAADEARHAQHAWEVVRWCLAQSPRRVVPALQEATCRVPAPAPSDDEPGSDGGLEPLGIPGRALQRAQAEQCLRSARRELARLLDGAATNPRLREPELRL